VQHRFTRLFKDLRDLDYIRRLNRLSLRTLKERRNRADVIEVFKLCKGHTLLSLDRFFQLDTDRRTRGHSLKICKLCFHKDIRKYFFSVRVINRWNSLSEDVMQSSVNMFKRHLQKVRERRMGFFMSATPMVASSSANSLRHVRPHLVSYLVRLLSAVAIVWWFSH